MDDEQWRTIDGFPEYEVSSYGNVRSKDRIVTRKGYPSRIKGVQLKQFYSRGYMRVALYNGNRSSRKQFLVHRLVADAFIPNPLHKEYINHKDENKLNNMVDNLEWCTAKYNSNYGTSIRRRVMHQDWQSIADKQSKTVYQYDKDMHIIRVWKSTVECERGGYNSSSVSRCCNGYLKTYKGYIWRYSNEYSESGNQ